MKRTPVAVLAITSLVIGVAVVGTQFASGAGDAVETVFVSVTPCRLIDTRAGENNVGPIAKPIGAGQTATVPAWGTGDGASRCDVPVTATAIATNATALRPTDVSYLTFFPAGVANPGTANINVTAGAPPTPNAANIPLSADGKFNIFNFSGTVDVVIDVNGY